ncbi:hypothetical protein FOTG_18724 [Fusarium oxysporum f. sp. vasinfectum 25433]|uniref:Uncharacterized protein n=1 Tax=Fusarium oxysporum f. sp. vasinfectum 25433 TaxID=1089449 RepID=X0KVV4_FUSOX|nr:hypothetical protein FOTG_18724 [Fusarium oxysporum f. sp. vasinfectum 25433]
MQARKPFEFSRVGAQQYCFRQRRRLVNRFSLGHPHRVFYHSGRYYRGNEPHRVCYRDCF